MKLKDYFFSYSSHHLDGSFDMREVCRWEALKYDNIAIHFKFNEMPVVWLDREDFKRFEEKFNKLEI